MVSLDFSRGSTADRSFPCASSETWTQPSIGKGYGAAGSLENPPLLPRKKECPPTRSVATCLFPLHNCAVCGWHISSLASITPQLSDTPPPASHTQNGSPYLTTQFLRCTSSSPLRLLASSKRFCSSSSTSSWPSSEAVAVCLRASFDCSWLLNPGGIHLESSQSHFLSFSSNDFAERTSHQVAARASAS